MRGLKTMVPLVLAAPLLLCACGKREKTAAPDNYQRAGDAAGAAETPGRAPDAEAAATKPAGGAGTATGTPLPKLVPFKRFTDQPEDRNVFIQSTAPVPYGMVGSSVVIIQGAPPAAPAVTEPAAEPEKSKPTPQPIY